MNSDPVDYTLEFLLGFDGREHIFEHGYYVKFQIRRVQKSAQIPHGIRYSFSMHDPDGKRILGYDNAHAIERGKPWDHKHSVRRVFKKPYGQTKPRLVEFESAEALLESFYCDVERILQTLGLSNAVEQVVERDRRTQ